MTGGTSGIGKAIAQRLLRMGYGVVLNFSADETRAEAALAECREISPSVILAKADVSRSGEVRDLVGKALEGFGRIDVLVNNAARVADRPMLEMTEAEWDTVLDVNLKGAFLCSQAAARIMLEQDNGGVIINIGASTGIRGRRNGVNTCASKAGLMVMTHCLALELAPKIRVNTVIPGLTQTDETVMRFGLSDPQTRLAREAQIPLGRIGLPEDVAGAVAMLLSDEAAFINGQRIVVDGGQNMW